jgi:hypothetical protein
MLFIAETGLEKREMLPSRLVATRRWMPMILKLVTVLPDHLWSLHLLLILRLSVRLHAFSKGLENHGNIQMVLSGMVENLVCLPLLENLKV